MVPDEIEAIVGAVVNARAVARWVITSGGIGPTHDDVTVRAVALALGREVVRLPRIVELLARGTTRARSRPRRCGWRRRRRGPSCSRPRGRSTRCSRCDGMFLLPGVPSLFRMQLETVLSSLPRAAVHVRSLYLSQGEAEIAATLDRVALGMPDVGIGSYPAVTSGADHRVRVTVEGAEPERVELVVARLRSELPEGTVLRVE